MSDLTTALMKSNNSKGVVDIVNASKALQAQLVATAQKSNVTASIVTSGSAGSLFLRFNGNDGSVTYGADQKELAHKQALIISAGDAFYGCEEWKSKKVVSSLIVTLASGKPAPSAPEGATMAGDLKPPHHRDGWQDVTGVRATGLGGKLDQVSVEWKAAAMGQRRPIGDLIAEIVSHAESPEGSEGFVHPIIIIGSDSYFNKTHDRDVFVPEITIVGWSNGAQILLDESNADMISTELRAAAVKNPAPTFAGASASAGEVVESGAESAAGFLD